ncbi:outer membrane beta-barrel protein [Ferruginibacter sp. HRS2-29]|uniref:outer membrane beta-barrel protein n=1 Tax=Ferruginibacter sp. HRS2-29 TaxID=2487334 RepID=UPI0020CF816F|nr:outer membrane beta-barrel protein [Ferruginibacter sp. HRS2-29]MCP9750942.1 TonB-dependent receptor [Ferruginibacter sp. HRS2-29]
MLRLVLLTVFLNVVAFTGKAQTASIKGVVTDKTDKSPIAGATVALLLQLDSSTVITTVSDSKGAFAFTNVPNDSFIVKVNTVNYQEYISFITINNNERDLGSIGLDRQGKDLSVVTVVSKATPVIQKGDTSQFAASAYKVNPDATTEDLIKKMPGITVAKDGTVTAQGETVKKVTIDGKDFFGDDASAALKNLPSEVVDKIQVFDRLSDQAQLTGFDDGNSVKAINVVTKSGIKNGQFGRIYGGYGTDSRYNAGGNVSFFKGDRRLSFVGNFNNINQQNFGSQDLLGVTSSGGGGNRGGGGGRGPGGGGGDNFSVGQSNGISKTNAIGVNYSDKWGKKVNVTGSYFFNNSTNDNESFINTQTVGYDTTQFTSQSGTSRTVNNNHRINFRLEYKIDSNNSLFIIPSINFQSNNSRSFSNLNTLNQFGDSINNSISNSNYDRNGYNIRNNIMFRHSFAKRGRTISFGFNTAFTKNDGESVIDAYYRFFDKSGGFSSDSTQNQFVDNATNGHTIGGNIAYTEPIGKKGQLQIDYSPSVQKNKADQKTYNFDNIDGKYSDFDTTFSNKFDNTITTNNAGLSYRLAKSRDEMFMVGVNFQTSKLESQRVFPTQTSVNQTFSNFLPNLMWRKKISNSSNIRVFYRASTNFPSVNQLQDVVSLTNPLRVSSGNPDLKQSYTHFVAGRYSYTNSKTSGSFFANILLQTAADYISNAIFIASKDSAIQQGIVLNRGSQLTKPINLDGYKSLRTFFTYSQPIKGIKTNINVNAGFSYSQLPGQVNYVATKTDNLVYNAGVVFASNISEYVDFNISYSANFNNAKTTGGSTSTNNYVNQAIGGTLNLLNKKGWFIQNDVSTQLYSGLSAGLDQHFTLWNAAIGKKFLKNRAGELKLSVFDLLKQNQSIVRTVTGTEIQDAQYKVLQQYFMLTFTYNLKNFGVAKSSGNQNNRGGDFRPMGGPMGGPGF